MQKLNYYLKIFLKDFGNWEITKCLALQHCEDQT